MDIGLGKKGKISLGIPNERAGYMLPPVLTRFRERYPEVEVRTLEEKADELISALMKGEVNFIILPKRPKELPPELRWELIYREPLLFVAGPGVITEDRLDEENKKAVDLTKTKDLPYILLKKGHSIRRMVDSILKEHKISPKIVMETSSCISTVQLAEAGYGVAIVPKRAVDVLGGEEKFCCYQFGSQARTWEVNVIYQEDVYLDSSERYFIQLMKEIFQNK